MLSYEGITNNLRLMVAQVTVQLESSVRLLDEPLPALLREVFERDDYIDAQKSLIEKECFELAARSGGDDPALLDSVRALNIIANNLEHVADLCVNIARLVQNIDDVSVFKCFDFCAYFDTLLRGIDLTVKGITRRDAPLALRICHLERELDRRYRADRDRIVGDLQNADDAKRIVKALSVMHYLERMGDALLNIGEALMFTVLGERLKIHQYELLEEAVANSPAIRVSMTEANIDSIWGTRSGVRVGTLGEQTDSADARMVIFKEGSPQKLKRERDSLDRWNAIFPGLTPEVIAYHAAEREAALLIEFVHGRTIQQLAVNAEAKPLEDALARLRQVVGDVWNRTKVDQPCSGEFLSQLGRRMNEVYRLHPQFREGPHQIGTLNLPSFDALVAQAAEIERDVRAPFAVRIHGDFNLDNIIYNHHLDTIHFVDVHRSRDMDYVQDVSVFLVSAFRVPLFDAKVRRSLESVAHAFIEFARSFAREHNDATFELRLALGLIRSFATSTRFQLDHEFARDMHQRAVMLLNRVLSHRPKDWSAFQIPESVFVY